MAPIPRATNRPRRTSCGRPCKQSPHGDAKRTREAHQRAQRGIEFSVLHFLKVLHIEARCFGCLLLRPPGPLAQARHVRRQRLLDNQVTVAWEHSPRYPRLALPKTSRMGYYC